METNHTNNGNLTKRFERLDKNIKSDLSLHGDVYIMRINSIFINSSRIGMKIRGIPDNKNTTDINTADKKGIDKKIKVMFKESGIMRRFIKI